ncbi:MAG: hypothetical protein JRF63_07130 [Deltaproteobacteria bacterium]|nr:hypothetical protein [Deltaproteobacteria bacterium]
MHQTKRTIPRPRTCTILNKTVQLLIEQNLAAPGPGKSGPGEWVNAEWSCSEAQACDEICKWAEGRGHSNVDPMVELEPST